MASCCENNHIFFAKQPGGQAQKRHNTFVQQTARCLIDKIIIHQAANHLELVCGDTPEVLESDAFLDDIAAHIVEYYGGTQYTIDTRTSGVH